MRRIDDTPLDPEIAAQLDAIDATLAGEPVDPEHAELAELALLLAASRPSLEPDFERSLDDRVSRRFARPADRGAAPGEGRPRPRRGWWLGPVAGLGTAAVAAVVAIVVVLPSGGGSSATSVPARASKLPAPAVAAERASGGNSSTSATGGSSSAAIFAPSASAEPSAPAPQPLANGRKIVQSAQLALTAGNGHIEAVAQELFGVVGRENGYVNNSTVTAGSGGDAEFQLSVPSSALKDTMTALSQLHYATVSSRTDATQDVNGEYLNDQRKLGDARALRTSLLKQLASAITQQQIDSLNARIRDAEASIRSDESTLRGLNHRIDYSQISVTINGAPAPVSHRHSGGFTIGRAAHDAKRVLTVTAGVALVTLAALVPVALVAALAWWIAVAVRRRRREQALDLA